MHRQKAIIIGFIMASCTLSATAALKSTQNPNLRSEQAKLSYVLGADLGRQLLNRGIAVDSEILVRGLRDSLAQRPLLISENDMKSELKTFHQKLQNHAQEEFKQIAQTNSKLGAEFLAENAKKTGVISLASGLQYRVLKQGHGGRPIAADTVTVNYLGKLLNGHVFDSSYKTGKPVSFGLEEVIPGWTEALKLMPTGSEWEVYIPSQLAYGETGISPMIGPNETLIFKIDLLSINHKKA